MTRRRGRSLFWTIAGLLLLTALVGTLLQALAVEAVLRPLETRENRARAQLAASRAAAEIAAAPETPQGAELDSLLARHPLPGPTFLVFRDVQGSLTVFPPAAGRFLRAPERADSADRRPRRLETLARHEVVRGGRALGTLEAVRAARGRRGPWRQSTLLFLPIAALASALTGLVMVRLLVRRLRAMEGLAARVAEGDLEVRVADRSGDEIGRVAEQLDRMAERLATAREQLADTERKRRQLFADITHELATPLTSIRGYAETLQDPAVSLSTEERGQYLHGVLEESRRMDRLIGDLFELARLEAGAAPLARERLDWAALCRNTVERFEPRFRQAGLSLTWRDAGEAWIEADGHRVVQVLENLLGNALRYVPRGGTVALSLAPASSALQRLTIEDDGPGIPESELPHVFERFYRGSGAARDAGGSGLGLAIVREIVARHGGTVRASARAPRGLAIAIELPAAAEKTNEGRHDVAPLRDRPLS